MIALVRSWVPRGLVAVWCLLALAGPVRAAGLDYVEVMTGGAERHERVPMIVAVHGLGDRPEQFRHLFGGFALPARVILPRGPKAAGEAGYSWFDFRIGADSDIFADGVRKAAGTLANMIAKLRIDRPTLGRPIITGFSQGGMLAFTVAALHPAEVSAAFPVSGFLPHQLWPEPGGWRGREGVTLPTVFALHGETDNVVAVDPARWTVEVLRTEGYQAELKTYPGVPHTISPEMRRELMARVSAAVLQQGGWGEAGAAGPSAPRERVVPEPSLAIP